MQVDCVAALRPNPSACHQPQNDATILSDSCALQRTDVTTKQRVFMHILMHFCTQTPFRGVQAFFAAHLPCVQLPGPLHTWPRPCIALPLDTGEAWPQRDKGEHLRARCASFANPPDHAPDTACAAASVVGVKVTAPSGHAEFADTRSACTSANSSRALPPLPFLQAEHFQAPQNQACQHPCVHPCCTQIPAQHPPTLHSRRAQRHVPRPPHHPCRCPNPPESVRYPPPAPWPVFTERALPQPKGGALAASR